MNIKNNLRFQNTEEKVQNALLEILKSKDFDKVTVQEVCSVAKINRSTFYAHYIDIYDLIEKTENSLRKRLISLYNTSQINKDNLLTTDNFKIFLQHLYDHKNFYRVCIKTRKTFPINQGFEDLLNLVIKPHCKKIGFESENEIMYCFVYFQAGFTTILKRWIENDFQESPEELSQIIYKCLYKGLDI